MMRLSCWIGPLLGLMSLPPAAAQVCDITRYGARANDARADTTAIRKAIDACAGTGGTVTVPAGRFLTGGLDLKSDMTFRLAPGAVLAAIPDIALYPNRKDVKTRTNAPADDAYEDYQAVLYASNVRNLVIEGPGTLDGQGPLFWDPDFYSLSIARPTRPRPQQMIEIVDSQDVTIKGLRLIDAPAYSIRFYRSDRVRAEAVTIRNDPRSPNTDGIQIRDSVNALITGADIATGDDAIVIKSYTRMVDNLIVTNSLLQSDDSAIKFGTAGHVGVSNSLFSDIVIRNSRFGIALFQMDGGAYLNNRFSNIAIETGGRGNRHLAIYVDIDQRREAVVFGRIEGLVFSDIDINTRGNVLISGQPNAPIRDVTLRNIRVRATTPSEVFDDKRRKPRGNAFVPATGKTDDFAHVPASVTIANTNGLRIDGLDVRHADLKIARSGLALINVADGDITNFGLINAGPSPLAALSLSRSADISLRSAGPMQQVTNLVTVTDSHRGALVLRDLDVTGITQPWQVPAHVTLRVGHIIGLKQ
jgi:polygalacturonase